MRQRLTRTAKAASGVLAALIFASGIAAAAGDGNPHYVRTSASGPDESGDIVLFIILAGLATNATTTVSASADATAVYACRNNG